MAQQQGQRIAEARSGTPSCVWSWLTERGFVERPVRPRLDRSGAARTAGWRLAFVGRGNQEGRVGVLRGISRCHRAGSFYLRPGEIGGKRQRRSAAALTNVGFAFNSRARRRPASSRLLRGARSACVQGGVQRSLADVHTASGPQSLGASAVRISTIRPQRRQPNPRRPEALGPAQPAGPPWGPCQFSGGRSSSGAKVRAGGAFLRTAILSICLGGGMRQHAGRSVMPNYNKNISRVWPIENGRPTLRGRAAVQVVWTKI